MAPGRGETGGKRPHVVDIHLRIEGGHPITEQKPPTGPVKSGPEKRPWNVSCKLVTGAMTIETYSRAAAHPGFAALFVRGESRHETGAWTRQTSNWMSAKRNGGIGIWELFAIGVVGCLAAAGVLLWQTVLNSYSTLWVVAVMVGLAVAIEAGYRVTRRCSLRL